MFEADFRSPGYTGGQRDYLGDERFEKVWSSSCVLGPLHVSHQERPTTVNLSDC